MPKLLLEKVVQDRLQAFLDSSGLMSCAQFAYWKYHSMETMIRKVYNDLLLAADQGQVSALVLCLLSTPWIMNYSYYSWSVRLCGVTLQWFRSFVKLTSCQVLLLAGSI